MKISIIVKFLEENGIIIDKIYFNDYEKIFGNTALKMKVSAKNRYHKGKIYFLKNQKVNIIVNDINDLSIIASNKKFYTELTIAWKQSIQSRF